MLTDADREAIAAVFYGRRDHVYMVDHVEAIVATHVAAALNAASVAIRARFDDATRSDPHDPLALDASAVVIERNGWLSGLLTAAELVNRMASNTT